LTFIHLLFGKVEIHIWRG